VPAFLACPVFEIVFMFDIDVKHNLRVKSKMKYPPLEVRDKATGAGWSPSSKSLADSEAR
jgi:hypothetical protein